MELSVTGCQENGEDWMLWSIVIGTRYYWGDQIKKHDMGIMEERSGVYSVVVGNLKEREHLENLGVNERIIF